MTRLSLLYLGQMRVLLDGQPIPESRAKRIEALLAYLTIESASAHRRETLVGLLFPELPENKARTNLRQTLSRLRRALDDGSSETPYFLSSRESTQFNRQSDHYLDVGQFESLLQGCEMHEGKADPQCVKCMTQAEQALELYHGPFLDGLFLDDSAAFDAWLSGHRLRLEHRALQSLNMLAAFYEQRGAYARAEAFVRRQLAFEPWSEEAHRQLMRLLAYQGFRTAALRQYQRLERDLEEELAVKPLPATRELRDRISTISEERPHQLPARDEQFVGRERELGELNRFYSDPHRRLMTLFGPGGAGKSALATESGWQVTRLFLGPFMHGVYFVPLARIKDYEHQQETGTESLGRLPLITAVAEALDFHFSGSLDPGRQLINYLRDRSLLLIVDNLEHLTEPGRLLVDFLLNNTEEIKILTTTRERLDLHGEWLMEVAGLPVSESDSENTALSLFERRGKRLIPEFALVDDSSHDSTPNCSTQDAARICRLVDGLPLGIEMAASWVRLLTCGEIAHEIENNLDFLQQRSPGTPGRHRSLRAVFDYSWGYLQAPAQETLGQLSVFCGVFDRRAAEQITGANLSQLKTLTDHALLRRDEHASTGGSQYELLSVVRQYAQQKLEQTDGPAANQLRDRHASYYLQHLAGQYEALIGPEQQETLSELSSRSDNLRTAWQWAVDHGHYEEIAQAANTLGLLYYMRSWFALGVEAFTLAANRLSNMKLQEQDHLLLAQLSGWQGWFLFLIGESRQGRELLTRSVGTFGQDSGGVSPLMLSLCATVTAELGDDSSGWRLAQDALDNGKAQKDNYSMAVANNVLSQISFERGDFSAARNYGWASLELERAIGNQWSMGFSLANMGRASLALGHFRKAEERFFHSLAIRRKLGDVRGRALCRMYLGDTTAAMNDLGRAQSNYEASLGLFRQIGNMSGLAAVHIRLGRITIRESRGEVESEHHLLVALHNAQLAESTPLMLEAIGELATERARKSPEQASTLAQLILAHRSAPTPVREQAASLLAALGNGQDPNNEYADEDGLAQQLLSTVDYLLSDLDSEH